MARRSGPANHQATESLEATLTLRGQNFNFQLFTRPLHLGDYATIQYYWMDSSQLRNIGKGASADNFQSVVGFWSEAMKESGLHRDLDQQIHYIFAVCYALVGNSKSLQHVYRDAYLAPKSARAALTSLPDDIRRRVRAVVRSRDRFRVQKELDATLGRFDPPSALMPLLQEACRRWVGKGVQRMREKGNEGLQQYLQEVDGWLAKYRRKQGRPWLRHFIDLFSYQCKAAFYTCYANAWIGLIPWLRQHRGLDEVSERFLRFWHNQNQPIEIPHGQTMGGILYPTHQSVLIAEPDGKGGTRSELLQLQTERIGPTHVRDVFTGQVLSLHPLSGFFMKDQALCAIAGRFFTSPDYDSAFRSGNVAHWGSYWDLVGAILSAACLYRQALDQQPQRRGARRSANVEEAASRRGTDLSQAAMLEDYAADRKICCPACGGALDLQNYQPVGPKENVFKVRYSCHECRRTVTPDVDANDLNDRARFSCKRS